MISIDFDYYKPENINEAYELMRRLKTEKTNAVYYAGGTEVVSFIRKGTLKAKAVIDLKGIPEMSNMYTEEDWVFVGANVSLNKVADFKPLEPMKAIFNKIADRTIRNSLTIGGNICGKLAYREAVLPLLASEAHVLIAGAEGISEKKLSECFDKMLKLSEGEFVYGFKIPRRDKMSIYSRRIESDIPIDYPVIHLVGKWEENRLFVGLSGFAGFPLYKWIDKEQFAQWEQPKENLVKEFASLAKKDDRSGKEYRLHLLDYLIEDMLGGLEHDQL